MGSPSTMPYSPCLQPALETWTTNVVRSYNLFLFPITAIFFQTTKQSLADRVFHEKYGSALPPKEMDATTQEEIDKRFRAFFVKLQGWASNDLGGTIDLITTHGFGHLEELLQTSKITSLFGASVLEQGVDALLYALVTGAWSNFESLASEVWEAAINAHAPTLAYLQGKTASRFSLDSAQKARATDQSKTVKLDDLEKYGYTINDKMGTIHVESGKVNFNSLSGIREAYAQAFSKDYDAIDDALANENLDVVSQVRHVIVHSAGKTDEEYLTKTTSLVSAPKATKGELLLLDGQIVGTQLAEMLECGTKLVAAVDKWLSEH